MLKKIAIGGLLLSCPLFTACVTDLSATNDKLEDYQGTVTLADGQALSLNGTAMAQGSGSAAAPSLIPIQTGAAVFEFRSHQHLNQQGVQDLLTSSMNLQQDGNVFQFNMLTPMTILQNVDFMLSPTDSGQPNPMHVVTATDDLVDVNQSVENRGCDWDCDVAHGTICYGNQSVITLTKDYTRAITVTWSDPTSSNAVATFAGTFSYTETESNTTDCE